MRWTEHVARVREMRYTYNRLVGKSEGKRPLWRPKRRLDDNIRMDLGERGWEVVDWMDLAQDRDQWRDRMNTSKNIRVPQKAENFLT